MAKKDLARDAWQQVVMLFLGDEQQERFHEACARVGLPHPGSLKALVSLDDVEPKSMRTLAAEMRCDASYITALVDSLEKAGYVERRVSDTDRRVKLLHVTTAGRRAKQTARTVLTTPPVAIEKLTESELRQLNALLAKVRENTPEPTRFTL
ncbi:MAG: MarR family winged helix-turn-helix transcriptional regulator [Acidimicrobiia bacterium]